MDGCIDEWIDGGWARRCINGWIDNCLLRGIVADALDKTMIDIWFYTQHLWKCHVPE